jgi:hypothetical protein
MKCDIVAVCVHYACVYVDVLVCILRFQGINHSTAPAHVHTHIYIYVHTYMHAYIGRNKTCKRTSTCTQIYIYT